MTRTTPPKPEFGGDDEAGDRGASAFTTRMFEACGPHQWARELLKNAVEAGASRVEFGVESQAIGELGVYRRTAADNGCGMGREELVRFLSSLGAGG